MLTLWRPFNPFSDLDRLHRELSRTAGKLGFDGEGVSFTPAVDIVEREDRVLLTADLPGVKQDDIEAKVHDGVLVLSGKREQSHREETDGYVYSERTYGSFMRQFRLGDNVDPEGINARFKDGVLTVEIPMKAEAAPRQIPVKTA